MIGAEFDLHCHLSALMLDSADVLVGYKEYPHTDTTSAPANCSPSSPIRSRRGEAGDGAPRLPHDHEVSHLGSADQRFVVRMQSLEGKDGILSVS